MEFEIEMMRRGHRLTTGTQRLRGTGCLLAWALLVVMPGEVGARPRSARQADSVSKRGEVAAPFVPTRRFRQLKPGRGLPSVVVRDFAQDKTGYIWIATQDGLVRFDGHDTIVYGYDPIDPTRGLSDSAISVVAPDADNRVWVGTGKGLDRIEDDRKTITSIEPEQFRKGIGALYYDWSARRLWIGANGGTLWVVEDGQEMREVDLRSAMETVDVPDITALLQDENGLWIGTRGAGLIGYDPDKGVALGQWKRNGRRNRLLSGNEVTSLTSDSSGRLWVGTADGGVSAVDTRNDGLSVFRHVAGDPTSLGDDHVTDVLSVGDQVWVALYTHGINVIDTKTSRVDRYSYEKGDAYGLPKPEVTALFADAQGIIWIGTLAAGVLQHNPEERAFGLLREDPGNPNSLGLNSCWTVYQDSQGVIWFGTSGAGLDRFDPEKEEFVHYRPGARDRVSAPVSVTKIFEDGKDRLWLGSVEDGLVRFSRDTEEFKYFRPTPDDPWSGPSNATVFAIEETQQGELLLGMWGGGLTRLDPTEMFFGHIAASPEGLPSNFVYAITPSPSMKDVFWIGTTGGLARFDASDETFRVYRHSDQDDTSISHDYVLGAYEDKEGHVWFGTYGGGLNRLDPKTGIAKRFGKREGLPSNIVYGVVPDEAGNLWLPTNGGLVRMSQEDETFRVYGVEDGIQGNEFNQNGYFRGPDGLLMFAGTEGVNIFRPEDVTDVSYSPRTVITQVRVNGEPVSPPLEALSYSTAISVTFSALSFWAPEKFEYEYKIEGMHDNKWLSTNSREISFSSVIDGQHKLRVRAKERGGATPGEEATLAFVVLPPPWKTWWAYSLYGLSVAALIFGVFRVQERRLKTLRQANRLAAVERELALTGAVQSWYLPSAPSASRNSLALTGFYRPAEQCSGDWWWYEFHDDKVIMIVADVTGHGVAQSLLTASVATAVQLTNALRIEDTVERLQLVNSEVRGMASGQYMMTITAVEMDSRTGEGKVFSAGGLLPLVWTKEKVKTISCRGTPLGIPELSIGVTPFALNPGERIFLMTDGLIETVVGQSGQQFGFRRMVKLIRDTRALSLEDSVGKIVTDIDELRVGHQDDDITIGVIEYLA